jgi:hypothetical protein
MVSPETGKWQAAVDASVLFYDLMEALRYPTFDDHYNSVVFRWLVPGYTDSTTTVPAGTGMKDMSVPLEVSTFNPTFIPEPPYMTPIGRGLQVAASQFVTDTEESLCTDKMIVLLSDGKHNTGIEPISVTQSIEWPASVRVFSVGLGEDDIEPETIENIADSTYGDYRISPTPREIEGFFCEIFCDISWKLQDITVISNTASIDQGKVVFIIVWDDPAATLNFELDPPDGPNITPGDPGAYCTYHPAAAGGTHAYYVCDGLPSDMMGDWHFVNINDGVAPIPLSDVLLKVIEDPQTIADFAIENVDHYTGQPIVLTAKIREDGKPKAGLTEVYAELTRSPAVSVGTIMAENSPTLLYPKQPSARVDRTLRSHYLLGVMKKLGLESLSVVGGPRIDMRDDGLGADLKADDGIYTGVFQDTQYEGSYTFRFRARGQNRDGVTFDRNETLSEYVGFAASPAETKVEFVKAVVDRREKIVRATVKLTPRDAFGSYLGPFRGEPIRLWSSSGEFAPTYKDNKDGSYSFTLVYLMDTVPLVSVSVGDVIVAEQAPVEVEEAGLPIWVFLVLLLLVVLILVICLYLIARRAGRK